MVVLLAYSFYDENCIAQLLNFINHVNLKQSLVNLLIVILLTVQLLTHKWKMGSLMLILSSFLPKILNFPIQPCYFFEDLLSLSKEASVKLLQGGKKGMKEPQIQWD